MRAFVLPDFASQPAVAEVPTPRPGPGEVLVQVRASSLNGFDRSVAAGILRGMMEYRFPVVLGKDFAGTVVEAGPGAARFAAGDQVFGVVMQPVLADGAFGEYLAVPENSSITRVPDGLDLPRAGVLSVAGATALAAVESVAPRAGETVLISGATGGVGAIAVQLAAARGATVIATARPDDAGFVRDLGAAGVVDFTADLAARVRALRPDGVDAVIHLAGDGPALAELLVPGGRFISTMGVGAEQLGRGDVAATAIMVNPDAATLDWLAAEVVAGRLRVPVQRTYGLDEVGQALADFGGGKRGKLAIAIA